MKTNVLKNIWKESLQILGRDIVGNGIKEIVKVGICDSSFTRVVGL